MLQNYLVNTGLSLCSTCSIHGSGKTLNFAQCFVIISYRLNAWSCRICIIIYLILTYNLLLLSFWAGTASPASCKKQHVNMYQRAALSKCHVKKN